MNAQRVSSAVGILITLFTAAAFAQQEKPKTNSSASAPASVKPFLGRWDITLKAPDREYPSWLEISLQGDQLKAQMVGRWGNARSLPKVELSTGQLTFVSPKEEEASKEDLVFEGKVEGNHLVGTVNGPDGTQWTWIGERAPSLARSGTPPAMGKSTAVVQREGSERVEAGQRKPVCCMEG